MKKYNIEILECNRVIMTTDYHFVEANDPKEALLNLISRIAELGAVLDNDYEKEELSDLLYHIQLMSLAITTEKYNCYEGSKCIEIVIEAEDIV